MLNWIIWNRTAFDIETVLRLKWIVWYRTVLTSNCRTTWLNWIVWNRNVFHIKLCTDNKVNCLK